MTLDAFLRHILHLPEIVLSGIKFSFLGIVLLLGLFRRISLLTALYLLVVFYLLFFNLVYEYYYTTLTVVLAVCVVSQPAFQRPWTLVCCFLTCAPSCLFLLRLCDIGFELHSTWGPDPTVNGWVVMTLWRIVPVLLLTVFIIVPEIKVLYQEGRAFFQMMREVNRRLNVFG